MVVRPSICGPILDFCPHPRYTVALVARHTNGFRCAHTKHRFAKASLLLTGNGTQGVGFDHAPDWDVYKNDDWGKRREVLRRLVNLVGRWIVRRRAGRRLAAIQVSHLLSSNRPNDISFIPIYFVLPSNKTNRVCGESRCDMFVLRANGAHYY